MTPETLTERAPEASGPHPTDHPYTDRLRHPAAILATVAILLAVFGWTFVTNPERVAPTKDPAYYNWRTEALVSEEPQTLLELEGAFEMFAGGYRVAAPVIGGLLRQIPGISQLNITIVLMVIVPVLTSLLLAGFAYRELRDPLAFHAVAFGVASLYLSPPFVGYLDNILCLMFLAASLHFMRATRDSWAARIAFGGAVLLAGFTHPTTSVIFCLTLGLVAAMRLVFRRFDLKSVLRDDGSMLLTAFASAVLTFLIWTIGIWGVSASLTEAALPPPYGSEFFLERMLDWIGAMRPALNAPLFVIGLVAVVRGGRRWIENDLSAISVAWLAPLAGAFGFLAGLAYPYYRFFNTTLAWVLLVGVGIFLATRFFLSLGARGGANRLAYIGVIAIVLVIATNFTTQLKLSGWNDPKKGWLSSSEKSDLATLRTNLAARTSEDTPVVFVIDDEPGRPFQIWGFTKLAGNTSRFGMPRGQIDRAYLYLGSLENYLAGVPTERGEETYDKLSPALLEDARAGVEASEEEPIVVVAQIFNGTGSNAALAAGEEGLSVDGDATVWVLGDGTVTEVTAAGPTQRSAAGDGGSSGPAHLLWVLVALIALLVPGYLLLRRVLPQADLAVAVGMAPVLSISVLTLVGIAVLAIARAPMSSSIAWITAAIALGLAWIAGVGTLGSRRAGDSAAPA
jgi:hypothetical protein